MQHRITVNRAPVLTLWAAVVAERLGFDWHEALTLGRVVAGLNAYAKGRALGIFHPRPKELKTQREQLKDGEQLHVDLLHRAVPVVQTPEGLRALSKGKPIAPESVERYLASKFGDGYAPARSALEQLAASRPVDALAHDAYSLYESFRPAVPPGTRGWGAAGVFDLDTVRALARR
jgi:hypothetical protein